MPQPVSLSVITTAINGVIGDLQELGDLGTEANARRANLISGLEAVSAMIQSECYAEYGESAPSFVPVWARSTDNQSQSS